MIAQMNTRKKFGLGLGIALFLVACGSGGGGVSQGIASLGSDFLRAFNQGPTDEPLNASDLDLTLTPTKEPFDV